MHNNTATVHRSKTTSLTKSIVKCAVVLSLSLHVVRSGPLVGVDGLESLLWPLSW